MYDLDYRIPLVDYQQMRLPHYQIPVDSKAPLFNEKMVDISDYGLAFSSWYAMTDGSNTPYCQYIQGSSTTGWLRKSFAEKLQRANHLLAQFSVEMLILDAYRSIDCQRGLWAFHWQRGRQINPLASDEELRQYATRYVRDPRHFNLDDARSFGIHSTGSSIDVILRHRENRQWLNMGSRFEDYSDVSVTDYFERQLQQGFIDKNDERLWNRRLLHWALNTEDVTNDPILYWHHDWGNQIWVKIKKILQRPTPEAAWYGYTSQPIQEAQLHASK